jgi:hypothetical protein
MLVSLKSMGWTVKKNVTIYPNLQVDTTRVVDPDPDWIRIQSGLWIRIRNPDPDPGGQK